MKLSEFVTAVLTEIIDGVKSAQPAGRHARNGEVNHSYQRRKAC